MKFSNNDDSMILVYVTCESLQQAEQIGEHLLNKRLCTCVNVFGEMQPLFLWPPKSGKIDRSKETVLLIKSKQSKYDRIEEEVTKIHTFDTPCIFAIPVIAVADKYWKWLEGEME